MKQKRELGTIAKPAVEEKLTRVKCPKKNKKKVKCERTLYASSESLGS
jgi:hypothetical protein